MCGYEKLRRPSDGSLSSMLNEIDDCSITREVHAKYAAHRHSEGSDGASDESVANQCNFEMSPSDDDSRNTATTALCNSDLSLHSTATSNSSRSIKSAPESRVTPHTELRKKHKPRHRFPHVNETLTSILKPSRYSRCGNRSPGTTAVSGNCSTSSPSKGRTATSLRGLGLLSEKLKKVMYFNTHRNVEADFVDASCHPLNISPQSWLPAVVDFSTSMEIYVYQR